MGPVPRKAVRARAQELYGAGGCTEAEDGEAGTITSMGKAGVVGKPLRLNCRVCRPRR